MKIHAGKKGFQCDYCDHDCSFTQNSTLKRHMKVHTDTRAFRCDFCEKSFTEKSSMKNQKNSCWRKRFHM